MDGCLYLKVRKHSIWLLAIGRFMAFCTDLMTYYAIKDFRNRFGALLDPNKLLMTLPQRCFEGQPK